MCSLCYIQAVFIATQMKQVLDRVTPWSAGFVDIFIGQLRN